MPACPSRLLDLRQTGTFGGEMAKKKKKAAKKKKKKR